MREVTVTVNGNTLKSAAGATLLDTIQSAAIDLPSLCNDPRLEPCGELPAVSGGG